MHHIAGLFHSGVSIIARRGKDQDHHFTLPIGKLPHFPNQSIEKQFCLILFNKKLSSKKQIFLLKSKISPNPSFKPNKKSDRVGNVSIFPKPLSH
jgi:hypothetical protein